MEFGDCEEQNDEKTLGGKKKKKSQVGISAKKLCK